MKIKSKKNWIILVSSCVLILLVVFLFTKKEETKTVTNSLTQFQNIEDASNKLLQNEANFKKLPVYSKVTEGDWIFVKNFFENSDNLKLKHWVLNQCSEELINKGNLLTAISKLEYSKFLWNKFETENSNAIKNIYLQNLAKLIKNNSKQLEPVQELVTNKYYSVGTSSNTKTLLLETALAFKNKKSVGVFSDAVNSKQANLAIVAIRNVKDFPNNDYVEKTLIGLTKNKNVNIQATAYKILGMHQNKNIEKNIPTLIASKNAHLVEAGIFVIKEMKLTTKHKSLLTGNIDNMDYFNRIKAQRLLDGNQ